MEKLTESLEALYIDKIFTVPICIVVFSKYVNYRAVFYKMKYSTWNDIDELYKLLYNVDRSEIKIIKVNTYCTSVQFIYNNMCFVISNDGKISMDEYVDVEELYLLFDKLRRFERMPLIEQSTDRLLYKNYVCAIYNYQRNIYYRHAYIDDCYVSVPSPGEILIQVFGCRIICTGKNFGFITNGEFIEKTDGLWMIGTTIANIMLRSKK